MYVPGLPLAENIYKQKTCEERCGNDQKMVA